MGQGGDGDPPVPRQMWCSGAAQQQLVWDPWQSSAVRPTRDFSYVPASPALYRHGVTGRICSLQHPHLLALVPSLLF